MILLLRHGKLPLLMPRFRQPTYKVTTIIRTLYVVNGSLAQLDSALLERVVMLVRPQDSGGRWFKSSRSHERLTESERRVSEFSSNRQSPFNPDGGSGTSHALNTRISLVTSTPPEGTSLHDRRQLRFQFPRSESLPRGYYTRSCKTGLSVPAIKTDKVLKSVLAAERRKRERRKTMDGLAFLFYLPRIRGFHAGCGSSDKSRKYNGERRNDRPALTTPDA